MLAHAIKGVSVICILPRGKSSVRNPAHSHAGSFWEKQNLLQVSGGSHCCHGRTSFLPSTHGRLKDRAQCEPLAAIPGALSSKEPGCGWEGSREVEKCPAHTSHPPVTPVLQTRGDPNAKPAQWEIKRPLTQSRQGSHWATLTQFRDANPHIPHPERPETGLSVCTDRIFVHGSMQKHSLPSKLPGLQAACFWLLRKNDQIKESHLSQTSSAWSREDQVCKAPCRHCEQSREGQLLAAPDEERHTEVK